MTEEEKLLALQEEQERKALAAQEQVVAPIVPLDMSDEEKQSKINENANILDPKEELDPRRQLIANIQTKIQNQQNSIQNNPADLKADTAMNWLTGIGQAADIFNKNKNQKSQNVKYWGDKNQKAQTVRKDKITKLQKELLALQEKGQITAYQKAQLGESEKNRALKEKLANAASKIKTAKAVEPTFLEKEEIKANLKERNAFQKENRKVRGDAENSLKDIDKNIANVKKAVKMMKGLSKSPFSADTGPIDQYISPLSTKGQNLRQTFNELSLDKMVKMFSGMSKAIDSDSERKFFEQSQVSMGNYPEVNMNVLKKMLTNLESLKNKNRDTIKNINTKGERKEEAPTSAAAKHYNASAAEKWAKANPNDPRALEILKRIGK